MKFDAEEYLNKLNRLSADDFALDAQEILCHKNASLFFGALTTLQRRHVLRFRDECVKPGFTWHVFMRVTRANSEQLRSAITAACCLVKKALSDGLAPEEVKVDGIVPVSVNWEKIENDYVVGYIDEGGELVHPSFADLVKRHGVPLDHIQNRAKGGIWAKKRQEFLMRKQADIHATKRAGMSKTEERAKKDLEECLSIYSVALRVAKERMIIRDKNTGELRTPNWNELSTGDLQGIVKTVSECHKMINLYLGKPTDRTELTGTGVPSLREIIEARRETFTQGDISIVKESIKRELTTANPE